MSAAEIISAIQGLSEAQRQRALALKAELESLTAEFEALLPEGQSQFVDLSSRGVDQTQAADLRARLNTFSEDWDRPETAIYDQSPAR